MPVCDAGHAYYFDAFVAERYPLQSLRPLNYTVTAKELIPMKIIVLPAVLLVATFAFAQAAPSQTPLIR